MNAWLFMAEADQPGRVEEIARSFGVDWIHLGAQTISFCIVCALLYRFAYRPVLAMLEKRRQHIADGLSSADKMKADLAKVEQERQEILRTAKQHADKLIQEARAAAARVTDQETRKAAATAEQIVVQAHEAAVRDRDRVFEELRREVGHLVVETTAAVAGKILTAEDQQRLAEETAKYVAA